MTINWKYNRKWKICYFFKKSDVPSFKEWHLAHIMAVLHFFHWIMGLHEIKTEKLQCISKKENQHIKYIYNLKTSYVKMETILS